MHDMDGLRLGMFLGGLVMAAAPISLAIGVAIYAWRRHLQAKRDAAHEDRTRREGSGPASDPPIRAGGLP